MKENEKLINAIIDLSQKVKRLGNDLGGLSQEMKGMRKDMNHRLEKLEKQQIKTNMELAEMRLSIMQMNDNFMYYSEFESRLTKLDPVIRQGHPTTPCGIAWSDDRVKLETLNLKL